MLIKTVKGRKIAIYSSLFLISCFVVIISLSLFSPGVSAEEIIESPQPTSADTTTTSTDTAASTETGDTITSDDTADTEKESKDTSRVDSSSVSALSGGGGGEGAGLQSLITPVQVSPAGNSGAAVTSIPIIVPPGRKGLQPNISLNYNSNSRNGWLGVGWGLDMGAIQRNTKWGVNYSANDYVVSINGSLSELVAIGNNYYSPKIEGAFSRYYKNPSGGWEVTSKDGTKYYYGATAGSRQDNSYGTFKWCLDKVQDLNGNYMIMNYTLDAGEIYLGRIAYTRNSGLDFTNYVMFNLEPVSRTDAPVMNTTNAPVQTRFRLKTIEITSNGQRVRRYELGYQYSESTGRSLLATVTQYGNDGVSTLPVMTFTWESSAESGTFPSGYKWVSGNNYGNGYQAQLGDFNGDGKTDIYLFNSSSGVHEVWLNNGDGTFPTTYKWVSGNSYGVGYQSQLGDFNGDGKMDIYLFNSSSGVHAVWLNNGDGTFPTTYKWESGNSYGVGYQSQLGDFNGDGKMDIYLFNSSSGVHAVWLNNGDGTFPSGYTWREGVGYGPGYQPQLGDFNGDGKTDIYLFNSSSGVHGVWLNNGDGTFPRGWNGTLTGYTWLSGNNYGNGYQVQLGDFNGDGKTDIYLFNSSSGVHAVWLNNGDGTFPTTYKWVSGNSYGVGYQSQLGDFNGDGKMDIYLFNSSSGVHAVWLNQGPYPDLLTSISNGLGATTTLEYLPSSSYDNCIDVNGTNVCLPFVIQTLSSVTIDDGNGHTSTTAYNYSGGYFDYAEREFRGFEYVEAKALYNYSPGSGDCIGNPDYDCTVTRSWFKLDSIFKGLLEEQIIEDSSGSRYTRTFNTFLSTSPYTGVNFPYLDQKDDYIYDGTQTARHATTSFEYDSYGNITRKYLHGDVSISGDERDEYTEYTYDPTNWMVSLPQHTYLKDSGGVMRAQAWFTYYTNGNLHTKTDWLSGGTNPMTTYTYDSYGNVKTVTDAKQNPPAIITYDTTTHTYPVTAQNALGHTAQKTYDYRYGKVLTETDSNNNSTTYQYDVFGRITKVTGPYDGASTYGTVTYIYPTLQEYGSIGVQKVTMYATEQSGTGNYIWSEAYFDGLGRTFQARSEGPDNKVIVAETAYNDRGLVSGETLPYFEGLTARWRTYQYDPVGRIVRTDNPDGTYATSGYMKGVLTYIDLRGHKKVQEKDIYGRTIKIEEYTGVTPSFFPYATTTYEYNTLGGLIKVTDANNNQTTMTYDTLGRKTSMTDPDMGYWTYQYDANGNLISQTDAKSQTITFQYDELNRIELKDYNDPAYTDVVYAYDEAFSTNPIGRLTTITDTSGSTQYYYDKLGRTTTTSKTVDSANYTTETSYDALGRTDTITYPDTTVLKYEYDTGGNLLRVKDNATGFVYAGHTNYNASGQIGRTDFANGVNTIYQYLPQNNRLFSITTSKQGTGFINLAYAYDNNANITGITDYLDNTRSRTYTYDDLNRLIEANSQSYGGSLIYQYDKIGNMTYNCKYGYYYYEDQLHRHAVTTVKKSDGTVVDTYAYDANGNMTDGAGRTFTYDYDNRVTSVIYNGQAVISVYGAGGQRVKKITPNATTVYIGDIYECTGGNCVKYIFAGSQRIAKIDSSNTYYYHTDHLGSSSVITDQNGVSVQSIYYYPYGEIHTNSGTDVARQKFTGQEWDAESGLYYYGARYYDPRLAKFISADTIVPDPLNPQALNRYSYCANNPINYTDPSGHSWLSKAWKKYKKEIIAVVAVVTAVVVAAVVGPAAIGLVEGLVGCSAACTAAEYYGSIAIGSAIGGAAAGATAAAITGGNVGQGAAIGAIGGAIGGIVGAATSGWSSGAQGVAQIGSGGVAGGIASEISGGTFWEGFRTGAISAAGAMAANYVYNKWVGYRATTASGGDAVEKGFLDPPVEGANNIGEQGGPLNPNGWLNEGGHLSRTLNRIPGINAVAGMHDVFQINLGRYGGSFARSALNYPGMLPAAAITYSALTVDRGLTAIYQIIEKK